MPDPPLLLSLARVLATNGLSFEELTRQAKAIALFGSRADGCEHLSSDWDLLCIGDGRSRKLDKLDLVWIGVHDTEGEAWLGGDLAGHVAKHGIWLQGEPSWRLPNVHFDAAARRKEHRLALRLRSLSRSWELLGPAYQRKHAMLLRRDVQRLDLLLDHVVVPPNARLDASWTEDPASSERLRDRLLALGASSSQISSLVERARLF